MSELWDVYDKNRNKTGRTHERGKPLLKGHYHLVVCVDTWLFKKDFPLSDITFQPEEVIDAKWVNKDEYNEMCNRGIIVPTLKNFYELYTCTPKDYLN
jgi:hypothetical protein